MYSGAATWEGINDMVSHKCGEDLVWWVVETQGRLGLEDTQWQRAPRNRDVSDKDDDHNSNGNSMGGGQGKRANTGKGKEPVGPDQCGEDHNNPYEDDNTRALERFPMCSQTESVTELVSPLLGI